MNTPDKRCSACGIIKPLSSFGKDASRKDGRTHNCRECRNQCGREYRATNLDAIRKTARESARKNAPKHKSAKAEYWKRYYVENRDQLILAASQRRATNPEYAKEYRVNNRDRIIAYRVRTKARRADGMRVWREKNQAKRRILHHRRKARQRELPSMFSERDYQFMMGYWRGCAITGVQDDLHIDHWIPLASEACLGTVPENLVPLCGYLNTSKGSKDPITWLNEIFGYDAAQIIANRINEYFNIVRMRHV